MPFRNPQAFIDKFRFNAKRASMVQSRIKALNRLEDLGWDFFTLFCTFVKSIASFRFLHSQFRPRSIRAPRRSTYGLG